MTEVVRNDKAKNVKLEVLGHTIELTPPNRTDKFAISMMAMSLQNQPERLAEIYEKYIEPRRVCSEEFADGVIFQLVFAEVNRISAEMMEGAVKKPGEPK